MLDSETSHERGQQQIKQQTKESFETVDSVDEAREMLESLENGETMLKSVVQGDGVQAGHCDEVRSYPGHEDELQVQPPLIGWCYWRDIDEIAEVIYERQVPIKVVDWQDRI